MNGGKLRRLGLLVPENGVYRTVKLYAAKKADKFMGEVQVGQWSDWVYDNMLDDKGVKRPVAYKLRLFELAEDGSKLELYVSSACRLEADPNYTYPREIGQELLDHCGPIVNASNAGRPYAEIGQETWALNLDWCADAINYLLDNKPWDLFYCHLHAIDVANHNMLSDVVPESPRYERFYPAAGQILRKHRSSAG